MGCDPPSQQQGQGRHHNPLLHSFRQLLAPCGADCPPWRIFIPGCPVLYGVCSDQHHRWRVKIARYRVLPRSLRRHRPRNQDQRKFKLSSLPALTQLTRYPDLLPRRHQLHHPWPSPIHLLNLGRIQVGVMMEYGFGVDGL